MGMCERGNLPVASLLLFCIVLVLGEQAHSSSVESNPDAHHLKYKQLRTKELKHVRRILLRPEFHFLGHWRYNISFLRHLNSKLVNGGFAVIDNFLSSNIAELVYHDTVRGVQDGWLRPLGVPINQSGLNLSEYTAAVSPQERCRTLGHAEAQLGFKFQFHVLDPRGKTTVKAHQFPGHVQTLYGLASESWKEALVCLLTGHAEVPVGTKFETPYFREFLPDDYALLHNDLGGGRRRALCVNYWFTSTKWSHEMGGDFLWCGPRDYKGSFPDAERITPKFNQASLFAPQLNSWHAVELVAAGKQEVEHRFSFTSWLEVPLKGSWSSYRDEDL